jgi:hypothetical protein
MVLLVAGEVFVELADICSASWTTVIRRSIGFCFPRRRVGDHGSYYRKGDQLMNHPDWNYSSEPKLTENLFFFITVIEKKTIVRLTRKGHQPSWR